MSDFQNKCIATYEKLSSAPSLDSVQIHSNISSNDFFWEANWSQRDLRRNATIKFRTNGIIQLEEGKLSNTRSSFSTELNNEKIECISPSGMHRAVLRECSVGEEKQDFLEVWKVSQKVCSVNLTEQKKHGKVHANAIFGCLEWSHGNDKLVYVAEKKIPKAVSFFKRENTEDVDIATGQQFLYREDWGEQLIGTNHPTLFIFDVESGEIKDLSVHLPDDVSTACALWSADDDALIILGWVASPWKVGLVYCKNRPSYLYKLNLKDYKLSPLTDGKSCVFSPSINPSCTKLVYLENTTFGPHMQCSKMKCIDLDQSSSKEPRVVIDIVNQPETSESFQGLFVDKIPKKCWLSNDHQLVLHSIHRSNIALLLVDISDGTVKLLEKSEVWNLLNITKDILFVSHSTPNTPAVFKASAVIKMGQIEWITLDSPFPAVDDIAWTIHKYEPKMKNKEYSDVDFESLLIMPKSMSPVGLIVNPHGGPHSVYAAGFDLFSACFCKLGYAVLRVNYRGSLGFGQDGVFSLLKNISVQDVCDVQQAAESAVKDLRVQRSKVYVHGGSHGGHLTLHLVGQYPDFYAAGATRNPVTDISSMASISDISDWCYCETGFPFSYSTISTSEFSTTSLRFSAITHLPRVKAPLLFMIGSDDRRVPPSQSHIYIHALKGHGKKVKVLKYDGNDHPIAKVDAEADCFVNIALWFADQ